MKLRIRRATTEDLPALRQLWEAMRLPANDLEKRLTEFQIVENDSGEFLGAIGFQVAGSHALLHSEGYTDYAVADAARELFWARLQSLASNLSVLRIWTQEDAPFWRHLGFTAATSETLEKIPAAWKSISGNWFTLQLKNEEAINDALEKFAPFMAGEKNQTERTAHHAKTLKLLLTIAGFTVAAICFAIVIYLLMHRHALNVPPAE